MIMKKLFILIVVLFTLYNTKTFAQSSQSSQSEHLTFSNIPITGSLSSFVDKLVKQGFVRRDGSDNMLEGAFADKGSLISVDVTPKSKVVYRVGVIFDDTQQWFNIETTYSRFKRLLKSKYGNPIVEVEAFNDKLPNGATMPIIDRMSACKEGRCRYLSLWKNELGTISLSIAFLGHDLGTYVLLGYIDEKGSVLREKEISNDL